MEVAGSLVGKGLGKGHLGRGGWRSERMSSLYGGRSNLFWEGIAPSLNNFNQTNSTQFTKLFSCDLRTKQSEAQKKKKKIGRRITCQVRLPESCLLSKLVYKPHSCFTII